MASKPGIKAELKRRGSDLNSATARGAAGQTPVQLRLDGGEDGRAPAVLPFIHQRMPLAMEIDKASRPVLIVGTPTADQVAAAASSLGLDLRAALKPAGAVDDVEYQEVSADQARPSPLEPSPDDAQDIDNTGESGDAAHD